MSDMSRETRGESHHTTPLACAPHHSTCPRSNAGIHGLPNNNILQHCLHCTAWQAFSKKAYAA